MEIEPKSGRKIMKELKDLIDQDDDTMAILRTKKKLENWKALFTMKARIAGKFFVSGLSQYWKIQYFESPTPEQYAIINNRCKALIALLKLKTNPRPNACSKDNSIYCNSETSYMSDSSGDSWNNSNSNSENGFLDQEYGFGIKLEDVLFPSFSDKLNFINIPLIHLSILLERYECFKYLLDFIKSNFGQAKLEELLNRSKQSNFCSHPLNLAIKVYEAKRTYFAKQILKKLIKNGANFLYSSHTFIRKISYQNQNQSIFDSGAICPLYLAILYNTESAAIILNTIEKNQTLNNKTLAEVKKNQSFRFCLEEIQNTHSNINHNKVYQFIYSLTNSPKNESNENVHQILIEEKETSSDVQCDEDSIQEPSTHKCHKADCDEELTQICLKCLNYYCSDHLTDHVCSGDLNTS